MTRRQNAIYGIPFVHAAYRWRVSNQVESTAVMYAADQMDRTISRATYWQTSWLMLRSTNPYTLRPILR